MDTGGVSARERDAYYGEVYGDYAAQNPPRKLAFYVDLLEAHHPPGLPRRVHDVGCAFGAFLAALPPAWEAHGSDVSPAAVAAARERAPRATLRVAPAEVAPDPPMGAVVAWDVLEHLPQLEAAGDAIQAQLLPGGTFCFVVPVYDGLSGPLVRLLDKDPTHLHRWGRQAWLDWTERRFELLDWQGVVRKLLPGGVYLHRPTRRLRAHAPAIAVVARRR